MFIPVYCWVHIYYSVSFWQSKTQFSFIRHTEYNCMVLTGDWHILKTLWLFFFIPYYITDWKLPLYGYSNKQMKLDPYWLFPIYNFFNFFWKNNHFFYRTTLLAEAHHSFFYASSLKLQVSFNVTYSMYSQMSFPSFHLSLSYAINFILPSFRLMYKGTVKCCITIQYGCLHWREIYGSID